jgi:hypothetical protein
VREGQSGQTTGMQPSRKSNRRRKCNRRDAETQRKPLRKKHYTGLLCVFLCVSASPRLH